jgi:DNA uptake protein ComE-like DNA-binding protein
MTIDPTQPARLLQHAVINGNIYHPRIYQAGELPAELLMEGYVTQTEPAVAAFSPKVGAFEATEIKISVENTTPSTTTFGKLPAPVTPQLRLQVNQATVEELSNLTGVTVAIAKKIVEERQKSPFKDIADLDARAPLSKAKWETLQDRLLFD